LTPEERRRFYKLLGPHVIAYPDRSLEVEFGDGLNVRERETAQGPCSVNVLRRLALRLLASVGAGFLATGGLGREEVPW
jgi:hypothetical protein